MKHTDVHDWRVAVAGSVAAVEGAGPARVGDIMYQHTVLSNSKIGPVSFNTPGPAQLALSIAIEAAMAAADLRAELKPQKEGSLPGTPAIPVSQHAVLYQFFERAMVSVTFSYQAIESFCNQVITGGLEGTMQVERRDGIRDWSAEELERNCSTKEKVGTILPAITKLGSPKQAKWWSRFDKLGRLRDSTIHLKGLDQYMRGGPDNQTLYFRLLSDDPHEWPKTAITVAKYFSDPRQMSWIAGAEAMFTVKR